MEYLRNLKVNTDKAARLKMQIDKYWKQIQWKNNAVCQNLDEASRAAKLLLDCGATQMLNMMPKNNCFHGWVKFCYVMTRLYNRDRPENSQEISGRSYCTRMHE